MKLSTHLCFGGNHAAGANVLRHAVAQVRDRFGVLRTILHERLR